MPGTDFVFRARRQDAPGADARFEYRIWPRIPHPAKSLLQRAWPLIGSERRADIYLMTGQSDRALVKLRDGERLEIKLREACGPHLQRWSMPVSRRFPLMRSELGTLAEALRLPQGLPSVAALSPAHLVAELDNAMAPVIPQTVRKSRLLFRSGGCRAELCRVTAGGWKGITVALEADDRASITAAICALQLGSLPNRSYGEALQRLMPSQPEGRGAPIHVRSIEWRTP